MPKHNGVVKSEYFHIASSPRSNLDKNKLDFKCYSCLEFTMPTLKQQYRGH